ncbi:OmpP1/FadL family transporter [Vulcaniibacterium gelatinicum]|uniref:OmpP1/FadL family transporter n=1 Tax=Vulcaniibacterium gelatinicum TaxID=2598725 RepID=UPI0011C88685|nr:outer membrane protein transport protein [Vulcaniibacterium gelatinicum]
MQNQNFARVSALALGIAGVLALGQAQAAGFQLKENSVKAMGRAFAGSAAVGGDASVVANNPAAMGQFEQNTVQADVTVVDVDATFSGGGTDAFGNPLTGGNGGNAGDVTPIPAMSAIFPLGDTGLTFGAMVSAPFGLKTEYDPGWVGRYHALKSEVKTVDLTLSLALDVTDRFSVGLGLVYERAEAELTKAVDFGTAICANPSSAALCVAFPTVYGPQRNDGFAGIKGDDTGMGWLAGVHWRPTDRLTIGYSHRSEIDHELEGAADFEVPAAVRSVFNANPFPPARNVFTDTQGRAKLTTPSIDTLSVAYAFTDRFTLMGDVVRTDWHSLQSVVIEFDNPVQPDSVEAFEWEDTFFYSLGGEWAFSDAFTFRFGLAYDETPTNDEHRTPRLPDANRKWLSLGLTWNATDALELNAGYVRIDADHPTINDPENSSGAHLVGRYDSEVNLFGVSAQYRF